ncbi:sigma 54-interacting transcriptional regulator [Anaeroselena agilis]|uniref:Sigma 54-interacting transcriptional regulator n=1 Tax=Anaeroselena agilis TaxID=3063788 RepID=A0ABU3NTK2_9FIRM|nr:sigma 54-interacting transcriptional regulator [Selenomonadales bacterium 4137-cl]
MNETKNNIPEKVNLALISTYPELAGVFSAVAERENLNPFIAIAALEEAAAIAREIEPHTDAILSRGGTADYIRRVVDIPVISIPITPFDAARSVNAGKHLTDVFAFFNYGQNMYGIRDIEKMFGKTIREYTFTTEQEIEAGVKDAKACGVGVLIGGIVTVRLARKHGLEGILIECGEEAVYRSMLEAIHVVGIRRTERSRAARFEAVLNSIVDGVIVTDADNRVTIYNPAAERIFRIAAERVIGRQVTEVIPNTRMHKVLETGEPELAALQKIYDGTIATKRMPIRLDDKTIGVVSTFEDVTKIQQLEQAIRKQIYDKGFVARHRFDDILTASETMVSLKELAALYATTDSSVLIEGESGTGKELFAQSIHNASRRADGPFVAINCAAIPEHLLESELFGYEGGAFTGARKEGKQGLFELAHNGTIFLDEIGEIPKSLQARLLRVLQEREIRRVGGDKVLPVDIRIISATNKKLEQKVATGEFRGDLYYRLNVFGLKIPPLRDRLEDIVLLGVAFLKRLNVPADYGALGKKLAPVLTAYHWPGNIRELINVMERFSLLLNRRDNNPDPAEMLLQVMPLTSAGGGDEIALMVRVDKGLKSAVQDAERAIMETLLARYGHDRETVAKKLGIGKTTLWRKARP